MGDRSNIAIDYEGGGQIYLYSHWDGYDIIDSLVHGLESGRVEDPVYLTRIIFSHLIRSDIDGETGYGISTGISDNEHPIAILKTSYNRSAVRVGFEEAGFVSPERFVQIARVSENYDQLLDGIKAEFA